MRRPTGAAGEAPARAPGGRAARHALFLPLALLAACAATAVGGARALPAGDGWTLVGHGEGATATEAHAAALADLAAQVRARVTARTERVARAETRGGEVWSDLQARQDIQVDARLAFAELARRRRVRVDPEGRAWVTVVLDRARWAARRRAEVAEEAARVRDALRRATTPSASSPVVRYHEAARAVAAARTWRVAEQEAGTIDPEHGDAVLLVDEALEVLIAARESAAHGLTCAVELEGPAALREVAAAACAGTAGSALLGARASDARRLVLQGRVEHLRADDAGLVFVESRLVLRVEGDGRLLEALVLGGPETRRGHLDAARAEAAADGALLALARAALEARFR